MQESDSLTFTTMFAVESSWIPAAGRLYFLFQSFKCVKITQKYPIIKPEMPMCAGGHHVTPDLTVGDYALLFSLS